MSRFVFALLVPLSLATVAGCHDCHQRVAVYEEYHHRPQRVYREYAVVRERHEPRRVEYREHHGHRDCD